MAVLLAGPGGALAAPAPQFHYGLDDSMRPGAFGAPGFQTQTPNEWGRPGAAPPDADQSRIFLSRMHDRRQMWYALGESNPSFQNENLAS